MEEVRRAKRAATDRRHNQQGGGASVPRRAVPQMFPMQSTRAAPRTALAPAWRELCRLVGVLATIGSLAGAANALDSPQLENSSPSSNRDRASAAGNCNPATEHCQPERPLVGAEA